MKKKQNEEIKMTALPDFKRLAGKYDKFDMAGVIERTPGQIEFALTDPGFPVIKAGSFDKVIIVGMGGSGLPLDVLSGGFHGRLCKPVYLVQHYDCPYPVDAQTLVIAISFSGNTEEVISAVTEMSRTGAAILAMAAGGKLAQLAAAGGYPFVRIPKEREGKEFQPRCATGYIVTYLARILAATGILVDPRPQLAALVPFLRSLDIRAEAEEMARWFAQRIPVIYVDEPYRRALGRIFKIKLNENAKRPAFYNSLPEANHNEMIGFTQPDGSFALLYLRDPNSNERVHSRFAVMKKIFSRGGFDHVILREWTLPGETRLEKIFAGIMFADWCSYAAALLDGIDPTMVSLVEDFKIELENETPF